MLKIYLHIFIWTPQINQQNFIIHLRYKIYRVKMVKPLTLHFPFFRNKKELVITNCIPIIAFVDRNQENKSSLWTHGNGKELHLAKGNLFDLNVWSLSRSLLHHCFPQTP